MPQTPHPDPVHRDLPPTHVSVRGPAALAAALPYLIDAPLPGTAVLALIRPDASLGFSAHLPLPPLPQGASIEVLRAWAADLGADIADGIDCLLLQPEERLAVMLYLPADWDSLPQWLGPPLLRAGLVCPQLLDIVAVYSGRWRSLLCDDEACCPRAGAIILDNSDAAWVSAELVAAGRTITTDEVQALREQQAAARSEEVALLLAAMPVPQSFTARRTLLRKVWPAVREAAAEQPAATIAALAAAADRPGVRDALLIRMTRAARRDPGFWARQCLLWHDVVQSAPPSWQSGPACLLAVAAWADGDSRSAILAAQTALEAQPEHRMADLVRQMVLSGEQPADWFKRIRGIREADCLEFDRPRPADPAHLQGRVAG